ncbi:protease, partial [bacterium]|nr:protease [bacterium]
MVEKSILVLAGDYVEDYELMVPVQTLQAVGY